MSGGWSWALSFLGVGGLLLVARGYRAGWLLGVAAQGLWMVYAVVTAQYGFFVAAIAYGFAHGFNYYTSRPRPHTLPEVSTSADL